MPDLALENLNDSVRSPGRGIEFRRACLASFAIPESPRFIFGTFPAELASFYFGGYAVHEAGAFVGRDINLFGPFLMYPRDEDVFLWCQHLNIHPPYLKQAVAALQGQLPTDRRYLSGRAAMITGPGYRVYGHWLVDLLPKLYVLESLGYNVRELTYVMPDDTPKFGLSWLATLGISSEKIFLYNSKTEIVEIEELVLPTFLHNGVRFSPIFGDAARFLGQLAEQVSDTIEGSEYGERLFLSRRNSSQTRPLINRDRIEDMVAEAGFKIVYPEQMPLVEQIRMFKGARQIVAEYGSALHGSIFSEAGTVVCGLRGSLTHPTFIQSGLGTELGQPTGYVFGRTDERDQAQRFMIEEADFGNCLRLIFGRFPLKRKEVIAVDSCAHNQQGVETLIMLNRTEEPWSSGLERYVKPPTGNPTNSGVSYLNFMTALNEHLAPRSYFEIGTCEGLSLARFTCKAICVDPRFRIDGKLINNRNELHLYQMSSDEFFESHGITDLWSDGVDIAFLDGLHLYENLLKDFINTERACHKRSLIFLHDCIPLNLRMTERKPRFDENEDPRTARAWTGDVWRMLPILKKYRPDLHILVLDCNQTGLVACMNVDPHSRVLEEQYDGIVDEFSHLDLASYGFEQLGRLFPQIDSRGLLANPADLRRFFVIREPAGPAPPVDTPVTASTVPMADAEALAATDSLPDLERIAREMCVQDGVPEAHWHLYIGKALRQVAST